MCVRVFTTSQIQKWCQFYICSFTKTRTVKFYRIQREKQKIQQQLYILFHLTSHKIYTEFFFSTFLFLLFLIFRIFSQSFTMFLFYCHFNEISNGFETSAFIVLLLLVNLARRKKIEIHFLLFG